jgi:hypothetical protein
MNKILIFFLLATCTVLLSVVIIAVGPMTNKKLGDNFGYLNCQILSDQQKLLQDDFTKLKNMKNMCYRQKTMYDMEYAAFIINIVLSFVCADLALLHYIGIGKDFEMKTGVIGLVAGVIGFILTLVYVCYSGYIFTNDPAKVTLSIGYNSFNYGASGAIKPLYPNGAVQKSFEYEDGSFGFENVYENDRDEFANYIKYKDLGKKRYNYWSKYYKNYNGYNGANEKEANCHSLDNNGASNSATTPNACEYAYYPPKEDNSNKDLYDRWLTALILACFALLTNLGLAGFGFLLFTNIGASVNL